MKKLIILAIAILGLFCISSCGVPYNVYYDGVVTYYYPDGEKEIINATKTITYDDEYYYKLELAGVLDEIEALKHKKENFSLMNPGYDYSIRKDIPWKFDGYKRKENKKEVKAATGNSYNPYTDGVYKQRK